MREIKFRGMDVSGDWHHGNLNIVNVGRIDVARGSYISNKHCTPFAFQVRPETVGQYTGLLDRNGKEIYEGDIVGCESSGVERYEKRVICYDSHQAKYKTVPRSTYYANAGHGGWTGFELRSECEVLGNIYEHAELLEETNQ